MAEKQLVVAVESTGAMGAYWSTFLPDYLEKIVRTFAGNESSSQKSGGAHFAMVHFNSRSNNNCFMWQRTGWTNNPDTFISWLAGIGFSGGGFNDACIAEGLSETILILDDPMVPVKLGSEIKKHCLLVCASNPFVLPTPVYRPKVLPNDDRTDPSPYNNIGLSDAETVARCFPLRNVSLSVISPKQLPPLRTIFNAGKQNPRGGDSSIDQVKHPQYLILLSENFLEARAALNQPINGNTSSNPIILRSDATATPAVPVPVPVPGSGPQNSIPSANASMMTRPGNMPTATSIKIEPITNATYSLQNPIASPPQISQDNNNTPNITNNSNIAPMDVMQDLKPQQLGASSAPNQQLVRPVGPGAANVSILNNLSQLRQGGAASIGLPTIGGPSPIAVHMSNMISGSSTQSNAGLGAFTNPSSSNSLQGMGHAMGNVGPQAVQGGSAGMVINQNVTGTGMNVSGPSSMMSQQGAGMNPMNMQQHIHQHPNSQQSQNKYVKIWEGTLSGQRQGLPVFICKLEGYRSASASDTLAADWPSTMQIVRLIAQEHMNNKQYVGKADFLVFRTLNQHGFLGQLQEKKLCAVIQLPSQTLLLSVSDKAGRLIGMLFPGDMVVFKPQVSSSQPQLQPQLPPQIQMPQQQQQIQMPQPQQMQQMQSQSQQPGMIGGSGGMGQSSSFMRPQMNMPQSNKPNSMSGGGGFMQ